MSTSITSTFESRVCRPVVATPHDMETNEGLVEDHTARESQERRLPLIEVLRQVASSMARANCDLYITLPPESSWRRALRAVDTALDGADEQMLIWPQGVRNRRRIRELALEEARRINSLSESTLPSTCSVGRPIRSERPLERPTPISQAGRRRLREAAKEEAKQAHREPYVVLRAELTERFLPLVRAGVTLQGVDAMNDEEPTFELKETEMIWDTGAHHTIISEELLSDGFRQYLKDPVHDPYRVQDAVMVQVNACIAFSNCAVEISSVCFVAPKVKMPNERVGVLFGQWTCIDRLVYTSVPRSVLEAKGESVDTSFWGDIHVREYLNLEDNVEQM